MATYSAIANSEIDADSPITAALMAKIRDNPISSHKYVRRGSQSAANATLTLADDGTLEFAVDAATTYAFKFVTYASDSAGGGIKLAIDFPAAATISVLHKGLSNADTAVYDTTGTPQAVVIGSYFTTTDDDPISVRNAAGAEYYSILSEGFVTTVGAGTVKLRYALVAATGNAYIETGSFLTYHRVDAV